MAYRVFILHILIALLSACEERKQDKITEQNVEETREIIEPLPKRVYNSVSINRFFSDTKTEDRFSLELTGRSYPESIITFSITRKSGDTLFIRQVSGSDLMKDEKNEEMKSEEEQEDFFLRYMSTFFAETSFSSPPYTLNDPQRDNFRGNMQLWEEIKDDSTAWCFEFSLSPEAGTEVIAYSKASDSIIVYDAAP